MRKANIAMLKRLKYFVSESIAKKKKILVQCQISLMLYVDYYLTWYIPVYSKVYIAAAPAMH